MLFIFFLLFCSINSIIKYLSSLFIFYKLSFLYMPNNILVISYELFLINSFLEVSLNSAFYIV